MYGQLRSNKTRTILHELSSLTSLFPLADLEIRSTGRTSFVLFFHVFCKISNFNMWTAKHLAQASCILSWLYLWTLLHEASVMGILKMVFLLLVLLLPTPPKIRNEWWSHRGFNSQTLVSRKSLLNLRKVFSICFKVFLYYRAQTDILEFVFVIWSYLVKA